MWPCWRKGVAEVVFENTSQVRVTNFSSLCLGIRMYLSDKCSCTYVPACRHTPWYHDNGLNLSNDEQALT